MMVTSFERELLEHHYNYEIEMLSGSYSRIGLGWDAIEQNAYIECFCLHARNLIEFFVKPGRASRFVDKGYKSFVGYRGRVDRLNGMLNEQITHLTDKRTTDNSKKIDGKIQQELIAKLADETANFKACLSAPYRVLKVTVLTNGSTGPSPTNLGHPGRSTGSIKTP